MAAKAVKRKKATNPRANRQAQGRQQRTWEQPPAQEQRERFPLRVDWSRPSSSTGRPPRVAGQCWHCGEMGHLRAACPKLVKPYPFYDIECVNEPQRECDLSKVKLYEGESADSGSLNVSKAEVPGVSTSMPTDVCGVDATQDELACESEMCTDGESSELMTDLMRTWDYEESGHQITDVQGRLLANVNFWEQELKAPSIVIEWIKQGYKLPLLSLPDPFERANHKSALENKDFVSGALKDLVNNRCVLEVCSVPRVCSPLSVVTNSSGKKRLVIDLRYLNGYLLKEKFKYEDLRIAMLMFQKGDYMFSFDLKSGYHHVDINEKNWQYLGFAWDNGGGKKYFCFKVLPFGLATACYVFTKLLRPIIKYWRSQSLRAIIYLDDGVVAVKGKDAADAASRRVRNDLSKAGLVENTEKSSWVPAQRLAWLGFIIDLEKGKMEVPMEKLEALLRQLKQAMLLRALPARSIASITGKIISMSIALGPVTRLMTRSLYALISTRYSWCHMLEISAEARSELQFWADQLKEFNGQDIWHSPSAVRFVYSDASDTGYGGYTIEHGCHIAQGQWLPHEASQSSTWRELRAVRNVLEALANKLMNHRVRWFTDNQNVVRILTTGSRKLVLQQEALAIFRRSVSSCIRIEPEWIPREANQQADLLSRIIDRDDWSLHPSLFKMLDAKWGPHTIDRFASFFNSQLPRFNSRFWNPGSEAVDAFTCDWSGENNWWCPPIYLVPRVLGHAQETHAKGTLLVPQWPSAPFWPMLFTSGSKVSQSVVATQVIEKEQVVICCGRSGAQLFKGEPNTNLLAVRLDFQ